MYFLSGVSGVSAEAEPLEFVCSNSYPHTQLSAYYFGFSLGFCAELLSAAPAPLHWAIVSHEVYTSSCFASFFWCFSCLAFTRMFILFALVTHRLASFALQISSCWASEKSLRRPSFAICASPFNSACQQFAHQRFISHKIANRF